MAALESYFLGRQLFYQRGSALDGAIVALRTAVDRDPAFAEAWTFLAAAANVTWGYDTSISDENALALAEKASRRALELDPNLGLALAVRANLAQARADLNEAFDLYHRALNADSNDSTIRMWFGQFTFLYGYLSEALIHLERAYELDPLVGINNGALGIAYLASGEDALAWPRLAKAEELGWIDHVATKFNHLIHSGAHESAIAFRESFYVDTKDPERLRGRHWLAETVRNRDSASVDALEAHIDAIPYQARWGLSLFLVFDLKDQFFKKFSRSVAEDARWPVVMRPVWLPGNRAYIEDLRFFEIMREVGTVVLWEQRGYPDGCIRVSDPAGDRLDCAERYR
jgi:tetratricopeptide (TPR) repeat protein